MVYPISFFASFNEVCGPLVRLFFPSALVALTVGCSNLDQKNHHSGFEYVDPSSLMAKAAEQPAPEAIEPEAIENDEVLMVVEEERVESTPEGLRNQEQISPAVNASDKVAYHLKRQAEIQERIALLESSIAAMESSRQEDAPESVITSQPASKPKVSLQKNVRPKTVELKQENRKLNINTQDKVIARQAEDVDNQLLIDQVNRLQKEQPTAAGIKPEIFNSPGDSFTRMSRADLEFFKSLQTKVSQKKSLSGGYSLEWQVVQDWHQGSPNGCSITTPTIQIEDNDYATQVWFDVVDNRLKVNTTTNLDIKRTGVGVRADKARLEQFSSLDFQSNAYWSGDLPNTLKTSENLTVVLGGEELGRKRHQTAINLDGLKAVYSSYLNCEETRSLANR